MKKAQRFITNCPPYVFTVVVIIAILWLTLAPHPTGDINLPLFQGADKLIHGIMFGGFTGALIFDSWRMRKTITRRMLCLSFIAGSAFGLVIEVLQRQMALGRGFEWADCGADTAGALLAIVVAWRIKKRCEKSV